MGRAKATTNGRLSVDDWIQAGFEILAEEGTNALKIDRLCRRLEVTKGSFYWHFTDIASYRSALVQAWGELRGDDRRDIGEIVGLPPRERLAEMMSSLVSPRHWILERAMREWTRTDAQVAASVRAADLRVLAAVRQAFLDYGFDADDADLRASATFAAGIGLSAPRRSPAQRTRGRWPRRFPQHHAQTLTASPRETVPGFAWAHGDREISLDHDLGAVSASPP